MATPFRGYTEIPGAVTPDVPYRVNVPLREIDADVNKIDAGHGARLASLESRAGIIGDPLALEDAAVRGLVADTGSVTHKELDKTYVSKAEPVGDSFPAWSGIKRIYLSTNTPANGPVSGDLVLRITNPPAGPAGIGGCVAWWDVSTSAVAAGQDIYALNDLSGFGNTLVSVEGTRPTLQITGTEKRAVLGTVAKDRFMTSGLLSSPVEGSFTIMIVAAVNVRDTGASTLVAAAASPSDATLIFNTAWGIQGAGVTDSADPATVLLDGKQRTFLMEFKGASKASTLSIDGVVVASGIIPDTARMTRAIVGARSVTGTNSAWGSFNEVAIFNRAITAAEKADLFAYAAKWTAV